MEKADLQRSTHEDLFIPKRHQLEGCTSPIHQAHGIPNEYYTRSECFEMEGEHLFNKGWFAVGFVKDLPQPGSALPATNMRSSNILKHPKQGR